jgi:adenylate kinase family enzyme
VNQNFAKDLEALNKKIETVIQGLYIGFIFVNFPKNENQAKKLENKISGFVSEFEKPKDELTEKILSTKIY